MIRPTARIGPWLFGQPYLLLFLTALFWGGNAVAGKAGVGEVSPAVLTFSRWAIAAVIAMLIARRQLARDWATIRAHFVAMLLMGAFGYGVFNILLYNAVYHTSAINVTIEQSATPMMIVLINFMVFRERISRLFAIGVALSFIGVAITATHGDLTALFTMSMNRGDALMMLAVVIYAFYSVSLKNRPQLHWLSFLAVLSTAASLTTLPFMLYEISQGIDPVPSMKGLVVILYAALFPSLVAQIFYARGVELIGANRAGTFFNLVPVLGSALAILVLGEEPALYHIIGYGLIFAGIVITQKRG